MPTDRGVAGALRQLGEQLQLALRQAVERIGVQPGDVHAREHHVAVAARHRRIAEGVRRAVHAWGLELCARHSSWYSDTVSAVYVPEGVDSTDVVKQAYQRYNMSLGGGLSQVKGKLFRIGHLAWTNELMLLTAIAGCEMALRDCGVMVEPGSGVAAAREYYRDAGAPERHAEAAE
mgnify:CR=1 FL=1